MRPQSRQFLKDLIHAPSPSGFEEQAAKVWRNYVSQFAHQVKGDSLGNSIATYASYSTGAKHHKVMLCAHIDEVGVMVHHISSEGFLHVSQIGGIDPAVMVGQRILVHGQAGPVRGVVSRPATHLMTNEDQEDTTELHKLVVDIGAKDKKEANSLVSIGDPATLDVGYTELAGDFISARALDDKLGTFIVAEALRRLAEHEDLGMTLYAVASVGEENDAYGARIASHSLNPDVAIAVDLGLATDTPDSDKEKDGDISLGKGPVVAVGSVINNKVSKSLREVATGQGILHQIEVAPRWSGTDADVTAITRAGIPTGLIGPPCRYMHTPVETVSLNDVQHSIDLLVSWCLAIKSHPGWTI